MKKEPESIWVVAERLRPIFHLGLASTYCDKSVVGSRVFIKPQKVLMTAVTRNEIDICEDCLAAFAAAKLRGHLIPSEDDVVPMTAEEIMDG